GTPNSDLVEKDNGRLKVGRKHVENGMDKEEEINHNMSSRLECRGMYVEIEDCLKDFQIVGEVNHQEFRVSAGDRR
ncbi:Hypothetical predicted protein, partial [Lynx pardinus]